MKTGALFLFIGFLLTIYLPPQSADARLFAARLMAGDEETTPPTQSGEAADSNVLADNDDELNFESAARLAELADLYRTRGLYSYAEVIVKDLVAMRQRVLGADDLEIAGYLANLADIYCAEQEYARAEPLYLRSLAIREKSLGPNHLKVATSLRSLGDFYREQNRHQESLPLYERALAILEKVLGPEHPDVAAVRASYESILAAQTRRLARIREPDIHTLPGMSAGNR
jgi:tetratricopeptide (TPR) repeat protein